MIGMIDMGHLIVLVAAAVRIQLSHRSGSTVTFQRITPAQPPYLPASLFARRHVAERHTGAGGDPPLASPQPNSAATMMRNPAARVFQKRNGLAPLTMDPGRSMNRRSSRVHRREYRSVPEDL
jgi:hypothetical protein